MSPTLQACMMALPLHVTKSLFSLETGTLARTQMPSGHTDAAPQHISDVQRGTKPQPPGLLGLLGQ